VEESRLIRADQPPESPARTRPPDRPPFRIAAVQHRWHHDPEEHEAALEEGIRVAAQEGAKLVCLQELTLSRYFAVDPGGPRSAGAEPEDLPIPARIWGAGDRSDALSVLFTNPVGPREFVDAIAGDVPIGPTFYDGFKTQEVVDAAFVSHERGSWVRIGE